MCTRSICNWVSINVLIGAQSTSWSKLSIVGRVFTNSFTWIGNKSTVNRLHQNVDGVSIKWQWRLMECRFRVSIDSWSRVLIDTWWQILKYTWSDPTTTQADLINYLCFFFDKGKQAWNLKNTQKERTQVLNQGNKSFIPEFRGYMYQLN